MAGNKLLRANVRIDVAYPEAFLNLATPTVAELNGPMVFNISCAIEDTYELNQTDSDTDDSISICDIGNVSTPTFRNYAGSLDLFRDKSLTDNGVFNLAFNKLKAIDVPVILIKRIGKLQSLPHAVGDIVSLYSFTTDNPVDLVEDTSMIRLGARFKPTGGILTNYTVVA